MMGRHHGGAIEPTAYIRKDFPEFWGLDITKDGVSYPKTLFDAVNASLIFDRLIRDDSADDLVLVNPEDHTVLPLVVIESLVSLLKLDMLVSSSDVIDDLEEGDAAGLMQGRTAHPVTFKGRTTRNGKEYITVVSDKGITDLIPPERSWRIQPSSRLPTRRSTRSSEVVGEELERLLDLPPGGVMAFQKSKALVVTTDRDSTIGYIRMLRAGGDRVEELFPMAEYPSVEKCTPVGSNPLGREPVMGFVSEPDMAADIALGDESIKLVIFNGAPKVRRGYGEIERLNRSGTAKKIVCLLKPEDESEIEALIKMGIDPWIWKRHDFEAVGELEIADRAQQVPFNLHKAVLENLRKSTDEVIEIDLPAAVEANIADISKSLRELNSRMPPSDEAGYLVRSGYSILNFLLQLPIPAGEHDEIQKSRSEPRLVEDRIAGYRERMAAAQGVSIPSDAKEYADKVADGLKKLFDFLRYSNPKHEKLKEISSSEEGVSLVVGRGDLVDLVTEATGETIRVLDSSYAGTEPEGHVILSGWLGRRFAAKMLLAPFEKTTMLVYKKENASFGAFGRRYVAGPHSEADGKLRTELFDGHFKREARAAEEPQEQDLDGLLLEITNKFGTLSVANPSGLGHSDEKVSAFAVIFEDDSYTFLTKAYTADRVDRMAKRVDVYSVTDLSPGDELVFASGNRRHFEEMVSILSESPEYRRLSDIAATWRKALERYMEKWDVGVRQLTRLLKRKGLERTEQTVRNWVEGDIIGPPEENYRALDVIADLTHDKDLKSDLEEVKNACRRLHRLHMETGHLLVQRIMKAAVQAEAEEIDEKTEERLEEYARSARILTVKEVATEPQDVPSDIVGRIFEQ